MTRTILVTGAGRGVGRECALAFARLKDRVVCAARSKEEIVTVANDCLEAGAADARALIMDVTDPTSVAQGVDAAVKALGTIDVLCHAAGGARTAAFSDTDAALWAEMIQSNLTSSYLIMRAVLPGMTAQKKGRVILIGSTASRTGFRYCSAYVAAKHGVLGLARSVALETAGVGVTVNVVAPGFLDVEATAKAAEVVAARIHKPKEHVMNVYRSQSPQNRMFAPGEVAALVQFLASDDAAGINGQCLVLDGGSIVS